MIVKLEPLPIAFLPLNWRSYPSHQPRGRKDHPENSVGAITQSCLTPLISPEMVQRTHHHSEHEPACHTVAMNLGEQPNFAMNHD